MNTQRYEITLKEYGSKKPIHTSHVGREMTEADLIAFYGLNEPDVEWYRIEKANS